MIRSIVVFFSCGLFLFSCKDKYEVKSYYSQAEQDSLLVDIITYVYNKPASADSKTCFEPKYRKYYVNHIKDFQFQQLKAKRPDLKLLNEGVKTVNGKKIAYFKFLSQAIDQKVFNYYFFSIVEGKIMLFTFNCIEKLQKKWEGTADNIAASLLIR